MEDQLRKLIQQKIIDSIAQPLHKGIRRDIWLPSVAKKAIAAIGIRRAGKTEFLWQILADKLEREKCPRESLLYFSFEDERLSELKSSDLHILLEEYFKLYPEYRDRKQVTWFLDEIQLVSGWESFIRRLLDTEKIEIFLSGSSAHLLSTEIATSMRGRAMATVVYPFSFRETLRYNHKEPTKSIFTKAERSFLQKQLLRYLNEGGFPEAQGLDVRNRMTLLNGYVDAVLLRDVIERYEVTQPLVLRWISRQLLGNAAGYFSISKFHADLKSQGIAIGKETLHDYLGYLEDAFLIRSLSLATDSEKRRRVNLRKVYPIDTALVPLFDRSNKPNLGHLLENAVLLELERRGAEVQYVRTTEDFEVDFLAQYPDRKQTLIQVCTHLESEAIQQQEIRALQEASKLYPKTQLLLITMEEPPASFKVPKNIEIKIAFEWFLGE